MSEIVIEIIGSSKDDTGSTENVSQKGQENKSSSRIMYDQFLNIANPGNILTNQIGEGASAALSLAKKAASISLGLVTSVAAMEFNRYCSLKEDYMAENRMSVYMQALNTQKDLAATVISGVSTGATIGSVAGPVGKVLGAVIGGAVQGALFTNEKLKQKTQDIEQYNMQLNAINMQTSFAESRASLINGGRGTEN